MFFFRRCDPLEKIWLLLRPYRESRCYLKPSEFRMQTVAHCWIVREFRLQTFPRASEVLSFPDHPNDVHVDRHVRVSPASHGIVSLDRSSWPRCLFWHGWLPALSDHAGGAPWAADAESIARYRLETALGCYVDAYCDLSGEVVLDDSGRDLAADPIARLLIRFRVFLLLGLVCMRRRLGPSGFAGSAVIWICSLFCWMEGGKFAASTVRYLIRCGLSSE